MAPVTAAPAAIASVMSSSGRGSCPSADRWFRRAVWPSVFLAAFATALIAVLVLARTNELRGQVVTKAAAAPAAGTNAAVDRGFSLVFDDRLSDTLAKFDEHVQARAWEKAFRILADIPEEKWSSMLPDKNGFIRPASVRVRDAILELPADGREAYRLFFDAKARLLFDSIRKAQKEEDVKIAKAVYDRYFITSVGDDAADRLADDYFQRGQFGEAARCWKSIFEYHPDTNLPEAKILVKRAIALYRAGAEDEFRTVRGQLERDFPTAKVVLGGHEVSAVDALKGLTPEPNEKPGADAQKSKEPLPTVFTGLVPNDDAKPVWQQRFLDENDWAAIQASVRNYYGAPAMTAVVPPATTDGKRVFCNWLGTCFAIDVATGKTDWTSGELKSVVNRLKFNNGRAVFYTTNMGQFAITLAKDTVLCVATAPNQLDRFRLVAYDAATGKERWNADRASPTLARSSFIGTPLVEGNTVFAISHQGAESDGRFVGRMNQNGQTGSNELVLHQFDLANGNEVWSLPLGTPQLVGDPDWGQQFLPIPALCLSGSRLYVLTNDGALLAINVSRRQIEWAYKYDAPATAGPRQRFFRQGGANGRHMQAAVPIAVRDRVVYFKESTSPTLYALEEDGPRLRWKWQDAEFSNLVGIDNRDIYLFSDELSAIPLKKPETRWSNRLSVDLQGLGARVGTQGVVVFTPRGLFELSKETGDVRRIFRGADLGAAGGVVLSAGKRLVCVSNMAVTAYPEPSGH